MSFSVGIVIEIIFVGLKSSWAANDAGTGSMLKQYFSSWTCWLTIPDKFTSWISDPSIKRFWFDVRPVVAKNVG